MFDTHLIEQGLDDEQVAAQRAAGLQNRLPSRAGKTVGQIIYSNVCTRINAILGILFVLVMITGSWINGAFGLLIVVNSSIGIVQELRARQTLANLSIIGEEHPLVLRNGTPVALNQEDLVVNDVVCVGSGNEIVVDGVVAQAQTLAVDESMLTGESDPVLKTPGDQVLSGSFVVMGTGKYVVTQVGEDSYAAKLTAQASKFSLAKSELQAGIDAILKYIVWVLVPVGLLTIYMQYSAATHDWRSMILAITGALVPMVPEGLILITSTAFALGVIRLGRQQCLVNELPAIEGLARVDVVCADKTGTLTENKLIFAKALDATGQELAEIPSALAQVVWNDPDPNLTMNALLAAIPAPSELWEVQGRKPFNSADKYLATAFLDQGIYLLGAPEVLLANVNEHWASYAQSVADQGLRVLAFGYISQTAAMFGAEAELAENLSSSIVLENKLAQVDQDFVPVALLVFEQLIRPDVVDTLAYFAKQEVEVKIISGDNARSVGAVTRKLGLEVSNPVDARTLTPENFAQTVEEGTVFGRVTPAQKQEMVAALQAQGHNVAMTGDGVNDVLALKDANIGVAMGAGAPASRAVANIVLLDNSFATLPAVVAEGRRVIGNIERVANLFLTKTIYSATIAILVILFSAPFPFQPIHVTITGWFTIGIPAFVLALPPNYQRARGGFVRRVLGFALPAGVVVGISSFTTFMLVLSDKYVENYTAQSTAALVALIVPATWVLACIARPWNWWKSVLILLPLVGYFLIFTLPFTQRIFMLDSSNSAMMTTALLVGVGAAVLVELLWRLAQKRTVDSHNA